MRAPDVLPASTVLVCADPVTLDLSTLTVDLPARLQNARDIRQREVLAGHWCARLALEKLGAPVEAIVARRQGLPSWPTGVVGSITHTRRYVAAAVARARDVHGLGLAAEPIIPAERGSMLRERLATPRELDVVISGAALDERTALTFLLTAKEALYKCLFPHVDRAFDYLDTAVERVDAESRSFRAAVVVPLSSRWRAGAVLQGRFEQIEDVMHAGITLS